MTLLHIGLRVSELCALTTADLTLHPRSGKLVVRRGKGMKYREVPLNAPVRDALSTWLKYRAGLVGDDITALMGHTSLETTRIYTTPTEHAKRLVKAVEKLES